ncbi:MAG: TatD family deoxyribonuclease [Oscillochloris sp.]|nr:TatD family deoxyribonuclease [Oscillochloris sp.]
MIDAHCHLDMYPDPYGTALQANSKGVLTVSVTQLPSGFEQAYPHVRPLRYIRLAVGLHPLMATKHKKERKLFVSCLEKTSYIGEVGLDFSAEGLSTKDLQIESFRFVLHCVRQSPKFMSIHSRKAERVVLDLLEEAEVSPVVFHWYSGSQVQLERLLRLGHFCSVNPAMLRSEKGRAIIRSLPHDRLLTETDGPYVQIGSRPVVPMDVSVIEEFLAKEWGKTIEEIGSQIRKNLRAAIPN